MKMFIVIMAVITTSLTKAAPVAPVVRTMDRASAESLLAKARLFSGEEKAVSGFMKMNRITDHQVKLAKPLITGWEGLFNESYQGYFDASPKKMKELRRVFKKAIREDEETLEKYFGETVRPFAGGIILRQLTWIIQHPVKDGLITVEQADKLIDRLVGKVVLSIWADGQYVSGRYRLLDNGNLEPGKWAPPRKKELILFLDDADTGEPVFSGYCGNPVLTGPNYAKEEEPDEPKEPIEPDEPEEETVIVRKKTQQPVGGMNNSSKIDIKIDNRGGGDRTEEQQVKPEGGRFWKTAGKVLVGAAVGIAADRALSGRRQFAGNRRFRQNQSFNGPQQRRSGRRYRQRPRIVQYQQPKPVFIPRPRPRKNTSTVG